MLVHLNSYRNPHNLLSVILTIVVVVIRVCGQQATTPCYEGNCGPKHYPNQCTFSSNTTSPINIILSQTTRVIPRRKLLFSSEYFALHDFQMSNTGTTISLVMVPPVTLGGSGNLPRVKGAGWNGTYSLYELHFHWGSEHLINGNRLPLELHLVHEQVNGKGGIGVIAILFGISKTDNRALTPIISGLSNILTGGGAAVQVQGGLNLSRLLPPVWDIFRYLGEGPVPDPPCNQSILWSIFTQRMPVSQTQVNTFATLMDAGRHLIRTNYRSLQQAITQKRKRIYFMPIKKSDMLLQTF